MEDRNEQPAARLKCGMKGMGGNPGNVPRFYADFSKIEWCGIMAATAYKSKTPETVIREAVREYLASRGIIQSPLLSEANARAQNRIRVSAYHGGILRSFDCMVKRWEFNGLCKVAEHDEKPIGYTTAHAIRYYIAMRGIEPPGRDSVEKIRTARDVQDRPTTKAATEAQPPADGQAAPGNLTETLMVTGDHSASVAS
jgi:hypothetical protein